MKLDRQQLLLPASCGGPQAKSGFVPDLLQPMTSCIEDQPVTHPAKRINHRVRGVVYINSSPASATTYTDTIHDSAAYTDSLFVCMLFYGTSALVRLLEPTDYMLKIINLDTILELLLWY